MRQEVKEYIKKVIKKHRILEPICELGSLQVPEQEDFADLRPLFKDKEYIGCDIRLGPGVDRIEDIHNLTFHNESIGTILIMDTLEHVENVYAAMAEIYRVLKSGGMVIMSSVMNFPIHDYPNDYWRFTPNAFELLLRKFEKYEIEFDGAKDFPKGIYGYAIKLKQDKKSKYSDRKIELENSFSNLTRIYSLVKPNNSIIDFGCSSGYLAKILREKKNCHITGIEINRKDAKLAEKYCTQVINCDIENYTWEKLLYQKKYNAAIFADCLEHLRNPLEVLKRTKKFINNNGYIIISIPNIAHLSIRLDLLSGNFQYEPLGILDDTHLKYFTKESIVRTVEDAGYFISKIDYTIKDIPEYIIISYLKKLGINYSSNLKKLFSTPECMAYQYIVKATIAKRKKYFPKANYTIIKTIKSVNEYTNNFRDELKNQELKKELQAIYNSRGWKIISFLHRIRKSIPILRKL